MLSIHTSKKTINIDIPQKYNNVLIKMSGGADSSLLAYLLCQYKKYHRPEINLHALTVDNIQKKFQVHRSKNVINWLQNNFNFQFVNHFTTECNDQQYNDVLDSFVNEIMNNHLGVGACFQGITMNPPRNELAHQGGGSEERDPLDSGEEKQEIYYYPHKTHYWPFFNIHKKHLAEIYHHYNLIDTLFPMTRSCEGYPDLNGFINLDKHCGECWWCAERKWGFGRLE